MEILLSLDPVLGTMSRRDGRKNEDYFYESIYFVLCESNVNDELILSPAPYRAETSRATHSGVDIAWI